MKRTQNYDVVIRPNTLAKAISEAQKLPFGIAKEEAEYILNFFGYNSEIVDNSLEEAFKENKKHTRKFEGERDIFYDLADEGVEILLMRREEITLPYNKKIWRIFYWSQNKKRILDLEKEYDKKNKIRIENETVSEKISLENFYKELSEEQFPKSKTNGIMA